MEFTYDGYVKMISSLKENNYQFSSYQDAKNKEGSDCKRVILRHDIDTDPLKALQLANIENSEKVRSTYFVLVTSNLYNANSMENREIFRNIIADGHDIGLHYDEMAYPDDIGDENAVKNNIAVETDILSEIIDHKVSSFSYHRPSKKILSAQIDIEGMVNSYSDFFFHKFKYLSDSRRRWREPVDEIIKSGQFRNLHILTHAFWYNDKEKDIHDTLSDFIVEATKDRYNTLVDNITDLQSIITLDEVDY